MSAKKTTPGCGPRPAGRDWRNKAACRDVDPELFFPVGDRGPALAQIAEAKSVCQRCPVMSECLQHALAALPDGIAGGQTAEERRQMIAGSRRRTSRVDGPPVGASRTEVTDAGRAALHAGRSVREVAQLCRVSQRTAERWAQEIAATSGGGAR